MNDRAVKVFEVILFILYNVIYKVKLFGCKVTIIYGKDKLSYVKIVRKIKENEADSFIHAFLGKENEADCVKGNVIYKENEVPGIIGDLVSDIDKMSFPVGGKHFPRRDVKGTAPGSLDYHLYAIMYIYALLCGFAGQ